MKTQEKIIIYQVFTRLFGNGNPRCKTNGSLDENGCGKMADFTAKALGEIKRLGPHTFGIQVSSNTPPKPITVATAYARTTLP